MPRRTRNEMQRTKRLLKSQPAVTFLSCLIFCLDKKGAFSRENTAETAAKMVLIFSHIWLVFLRARVLSVCHPV